MTTENKPKSLSEALGLFAPEGANDARWYLIEHQLEQVKISARTVVGSLQCIVDKPESAEEGYIADDCLSFARSMLCDILGHIASIYSYLSNSDVLERVARKEM